jgi:5'-nucleotidase
VLVTNDDGVRAPGLRWLAVAAREQGAEVVVAAPLSEASGTGAAMTAVVQDGRVVVERLTLTGLPETAVYGVAGSPGYIVVLASLGAFGDPPDLVLSGINRGANAGNAVLHSGTVGAALTAANSGFRAMAISLDVLSPAAGTAGTGGAAIADLDLVSDEARNWRTAADLACTLLPTVTGAPERTVLNLNVPDLPSDRLRGLRRAKIARFGQVEMSVAEIGEGFVRTSVQESGARVEPGTELAYLAEGYATVTAIRAIVEAEDVRLDL